MSELGAVGPKNVTTVAKEITEGIGEIQETLEAAPDKAGAVVDMIEDGVGAPFELQPGESVEKRAERFTGALKSLGEELEKNPEYLTEFATKLEAGDEKAEGLADDLGLPIRSYPQGPVEWSDEAVRIGAAVDGRKDGFSPQAVQALDLLAMYRVNGQPISQVDLWHGSHVMVADGDLYTRLAALAISADADATPRTSSHVSDVSQYEIRFEGLGVMLFGMKDGKTWFQMENTSGSAEDLGEIFGHLGDFFIHLFSRQNVGPLGLSPKTDKDPLQAVII
jgi:hypothetical protein